MRGITAACRALCLAAGLGASAGAGAAVAAVESVVDVARATVRLPAGEWLSLARSTVDAVRVNDQRSIPADFAGAQDPLSGVGDAALPSGVDDRHAAYAVQLLNRVRDCVYSIRGQMDFPPIHFIPAAPAEARIARLDH